MDRAKLEELVAKLANATSRRKTIKGLLGGALASAAALAETAARGKKHKKRRAGRNDGQGKGRAGKRQGKGKHRKGGKGNVKAMGKAVGRKRDGDDGAQTASTERRAGAAKRCKKNGQNCRQLQANANDPLY